MTFIIIVMFCFETWGNDALQTLLWQCVFMYFEGGMALERTLKGGWDIFLCYAFKASLLLLASMQLHILALMAKLNELINSWMIKSSPFFTEYAISLGHTDYRSKMSWEWQSMLLIDVNIYHASIVVRWMLRFIKYFMANSSFLCCLVFNRKNGLESFSEVAW